MVSYSVDLIIVIIYYGYFVELRVIKIGMGGIKMVDRMFNGYNGKPRNLDCRMFNNTYLRCVPMTISSSMLMLRLYNEKTYYISIPLLCQSILFI